MAHDRPPLATTAEPGATPRRAPFLSTAAVLLGFVLLSQALPWAEHAFPSQVPPLFLRWDPLASLELLVPLALGLCLWLTLPRLLRGSAVVLLVALTAFGWLFSVTLAVESGQLRTFKGCCRGHSVAKILTFPTGRASDYYVNVPLVDRLGPRAFAREFPRLDEGTDRLSLHARTHPPGAVLFLWAMAALTGHSLLAVSLLIVLIGALAVVPTYLVAREAYDERVARRAAVLFACSPGVILYSATSMDAVFMTVIAVAMAVLVRAPRSDRWAVLAGVLTGVSLALTWAALALFPLALGIGFLERRRARPSVPIGRRAFLAVLGVVAGALVLRVVAGIDLVADFRSSFGHQSGDYSMHRPYPYWIVGDVVGFLVTAGIAQSALLVHELRTRWRAHEPGLETVFLVVLVASSLIGVFRGEIDHSWLFFIPLVAACGAAASERIRGVAAAGLGQAVVTEVLFYTGW